MNHLDNLKMRPQTKPERSEDATKQTSVPPAHAITLGDAILRNPANLGKQVASTVMLDANFWLMVDVCGSPIWAMA
jgi:hypothetical protein